MKQVVLKSMKETVQDRFPEAVAAHAWEASDGYNGWRICLPDGTELGFSPTQSAEAAWRDAYVKIYGRE